MHDKQTQGAKFVLASSQYARGRLAPGAHLLPRVTTAFTPRWPHLGPRRYKRPGRAPGCGSPLKAASPARRLHRHPGAPAARPPAGSAQAKAAAAPGHRGRGSVLPSGRFAPCAGATGPGAGAQQELDRPPPAAERGPRLWGTGAARPARRRPDGGAAAPPAAEARRRGWGPAAARRGPGGGGGPGAPWPGGRRRRRSGGRRWEEEPLKGGAVGAGRAAAVAGRRGLGCRAAAGGAPFPGRRGGPRRYAAGIMAGASAVSPLVCALQRGARAWRMGHRPPLCRRHFNRPHLQYSTCCRQRGSPGAHTPPEGLGGSGGGTGTGRQASPPSHRGEALGGSPVAWPGPCEPGWQMVPAEQLHP